MAHGTLTMKNTTTGETKVAPTGFSWTVLLFGAFPALFRLDWKNFGIMVGILFVTGILGIWFIPLVVFGFIYNDKMHIRDLINSGWKIERYTGSKSIQVVQNSVGYDLTQHMAE
jgi:hypothetical protein